MADGNTPTYNLILPEIDGADGTWGVSLNANLGSLDSLLSGGTALSAITVTGTVTAGDIDVTGTVTADAFIGDSLTTASVLNIQAPIISLKNSSGSPMVTTDSDSVTLRWQGASSVGPKLDTTEEGVDVSGEMKAETIQLNSPAPTTDVTNAYPIINLVNSNIVSPSAGVFAGVQIGPTNYRAKVNAADGSVPSATYAFTQAKTVGVTEGAENGSYEIWVKKAGVDTNILQVEDSGIGVTGTVTADEIVFTRQQPEDKIRRSYQHLT